jgi:hypothetical protein
VVEIGRSRGTHVAEAGSGVWTGVEEDANLASFVPKIIIIIIIWQVLGSEGDSCLSPSV